MARRIIKLGSCLGIPIHLDASWFVILALMAWTLATHLFPSQFPGLSQAVYWVMGPVAAVLLFSCVLLHELGHCVMAQQSGVPVKRVTLFLFGGVAQLGGESRRPLVELKVALAGPLVSVLLAALCMGLSSIMPVQTTIQLVGFLIVRYLAIVNTVILCFNLLPGFPLDGGRVLRAALWAWSGDVRQATRIASLFGSALGIGLAVLGGVWLLKGRWLGGVWYVVLGVFLRDTARASYAQVLAQTPAQPPAVSALVTSSSA